MGKVLSEINCRVDLWSREGLSAYILCSLGLVEVEAKARLQTNQTLPQNNACEQNARVTCFGEMIYTCLWNI